jgi:uncharacterized membrane protein
MAVPFTLHEDVIEPTDYKVLLAIVDKVTHAKAMMWIGEHEGEVVLGVTTKAGTALIDPVLITATLLTGPLSMEDLQDDDD